VKGGSASKISLIEPMQASPRCAAKPSISFSMPWLSSGYTLIHASANGPASQPHTVPWW
jgi:hypothetical protein